jgi:hypothetical protein
MSEKSDTRNDRRGILDRRSYLKIASSAVVAGGTAAGVAPTMATSEGANRTASDQTMTPNDVPDPNDFQYDDVYDVVDDLGMDPTGEEPIDDTLRDNLASNTKLEFPQGTYRVTELVYDYGEGLHDFGMVGVETGATIVLDTPDSATPNPGASWLSLGGNGSYNIQYEGLRHDVGSAPEAPRMQINVDDGLFVRDVLHRGVHDGSLGPFVFGLFSEDGTGLIDELRAPDGAPDGSGAVGLFVNQYMKGNLELRNCWIEGFPNNGLYESSKSTGALTVNGGLYKNNNIANVRLAGSGGTVRDCCVVVNRSHSDPDFPTNMRGIWLFADDATVENCDVVQVADAPSDGGLVAAGSGTTEIRDTRIRIGTDDTAAMYAVEPETTPAPVVCSGVEVKGGADHTGSGYPGSAALRAFGRPNSVFESCCVNQTGNDRDGVLLQYCDGSRVSGSSFDVTGDAITLDHSDDVTERDNAVGTARCANATCPDDLNTTVDRFKDATLSNYSFDRGESGASVVSSPSRSGKSALSLANTATEMTSTDGLPTYPSAGETVSYWLRGDGGAADVNLSYGVQDADNRYFVRVDLANADLMLFRYEDGMAHQLDSDSSGYTLSQKTWYELVVDWSEEGNHMATLRDADGNHVARVSGSDGTWSSGGIGYDAYLDCGQRVVLDDVKLK